MRRTLSSEAAYMLRNTGEILNVGEDAIHPYLIRDNPDGMPNDEVADYMLKEIQMGLPCVKWFYDHTSNKEAKDSIKKWALLTYNSPYADDRAKKTLVRLFGTMRAFTANPIDVLGMYRLLNDGLNQEFCRVRASGMYFGEGESTIYIRVSSKGYNWFNAIWAFLYKYGQGYDNVTILRDAQAGGHYADAFYKIGRDRMQDFPITEFIELSGRPVIESGSRSRRLLAQGKSVFESFGAGNPNNLSTAYHSIRENMQW